MKTDFIAILCVCSIWLMSGCAATEDFVTCTEPRPQICTMEYIPVCATLETGEQKTYATGCTACADIQVTGYSAGECQ